MDPNKIQTEDAFTTEDDWTILPADQGKISPNGVVYDSSGNELYKIYEDEPTESAIVYLSDGEEFNFVEKE
jgi:hypothetical protein